MAKQQRPQALNVTSTTAIITEHDEEGKDIHYEDGGGGCFRLFCCFDSHRDGETAEFLYRQESGDLVNKDTWLMNRVKSLKEYSELVAGPKWKNFIRRFNRRTKNTAFQYDPESYALNFNDGGDDHEDDDLLPHSFSTRFAPPSRSMQI